MPPPIVCNTSSFLGTAKTRAILLSVRGLAFALLFLLARAARADDTHYQDYALGGRASGIGGAYGAIADDPSGLFYNPAGIVDTHRTTVDVETSLYGVELNWRQRTPFPLRELRQFSPADLNVIPGDAGAIYGLGSRTLQGAPLAWGFDFSVPSYHALTVHQTSVDAQQNSVWFDRSALDRTFAAALGLAMRTSTLVSFGVSAVASVRSFQQEERITVRGSKTFEYTTDAVQFENVQAYLIAGAKVAWETWLFGATLGSPTVKLHETGTIDIVRVQDGSRFQRFPTPASVHSDTPQPLFLRLATAYFRPKSWTVSAQATLHLPVNYNRLAVDAPDAESATLLQQTIAVSGEVRRRMVVDFNAGMDVLLTQRYACSFGAFTDFSSAPALETVAGSDRLTDGSSRLPHVNLFGVTASGGLLGPNSLTRFGLSVSYGRGEDAVPGPIEGSRRADRRVEVNQLFGYFFLSSTFRY